MRSIIRDPSAQQKPQQKAQAQTVRVTDHHSTSDCHYRHWPEKVKNDKEGNFNRPPESGTWLD
jgi:hypothetical protein